LRTFGAGESAYTFCEPADEVLSAHHNGDTAGSLEKKLIGRRPPGRPKGPAEPMSFFLKSPSTPSSARRWWFGTGGVIDADEIGACGCFRECPMRFRRIRALRNSLRRPQEAHGNQAQGNRSRNQAFPPRILQGIPPESAQSYYSMIGTVTKTILPSSVML
jgi:hypothetical protein